MPARVDRPVLRRAALSLGAAVVLVFVVIGYAWFLGGQFTAPLRPGEQVGRLLKEAGFAGGPNLMAALFVLNNVLFWFLVFFGVSLVARRRRAAG